MKKKHHVMRFNATLNVDFAKWTHVKMERENNIKEFKGFDEDMPKYVNHYSLKKPSVNKSCGCGRNLLLCNSKKRLNYNSHI